MEEIKKTIELWSKEFKVNIIDPDGFDRTDPRLYERLFTRQEFKERVLRCTLLPMRGTSFREIFKLCS